MLDHLQWDTLETRRTIARLTMMYRIDNDLVDIPAQEFLVPSKRRTRATHARKFQTFSPRTDYLKHSFFPWTVVVWNALPAAVAEAPSLVSFKRELANYLH